MSVDPRFDPAFQRGYDPAQDASGPDAGPAPRPADAPRSALAAAGPVLESAPAPVRREPSVRRDPPARRDAPVRADASDTGSALGSRSPAREPDGAASPAWVSAAPSVDADGFHPAELASRPSDPAVDRDSPGGDVEAELPPQSRRERAVILVLLVGSALLAVAGLIGVIALASHPPLSLATAANAQSATTQLTAELLCGPALAVGAVGLAIALALTATARRRGGPRPADPEDA